MEGARVRLISGLLTAIADPLQQFLDSCGGIMRLALCLIVTQWAAKRGK